MNLNSYIAGLLLFCSISSAKAQALVPSSVRQIFNLEKGDSLEYHVWTVASGCGTICNWYEMKTVDSLTYSSAQDTLFISFHTDLIRFDTGAPVSQCGHCQQEFIFGDICPVNASRWAIAYPDSSINYLQDTTYGAYFGRRIDSVYINPAAYNGSKQNFYYLQRDDLSNCHEIYVDSIGIALKIESYQHGNSNLEQLIYYHKANGSKWGTPFFMVGINSIPSEEAFAVYPNPTDDRFIIQAGSSSGRHFILFDALFKKVMDLNLTGNETRVNRNDLSSGLYFWQIVSGNDVIQTGKLVMK